MIKSPFVLIKDAAVLITSSQQFLFSDKLTENEILSNLFAFFTAGHEPTSHSITFTLHELSFNPQIQEKLRREIMKAREENGGVLDYTAIQKIAYLEMVIAGRLTIRCHEV